MIVAIGLDVDPTFPTFVAAALSRGVAVGVLNLRAAIEGEWRIPLPPGEPAQFWYAGYTVELGPKDGYFCRIIDMSSQQRDVAGTRRWIALTRALGKWLDQVPGRVANRSRVGSHNSSKPLHEAILSGMGFRVPPSISSCDLDQLIDFIDQGPTISKALSGVRADTVIATRDLLAAFDPAGGPVHLQRRVHGADARIHVVGDKLVAQRVPPSEGIDYRREGRLDELEQFDPPADLRDALVSGSAELGLPFAGWDFRIDPEGQYWCLEVNPMPGYGPYDAQCQGAISALLVEYLAEEAVP
jgi:hypothetical protein